jgi:hypothetical protein
MGHKPKWPGRKGSQWQNGKQVTVWPAKIAEGKLVFPKFAKFSQ